MVQDRRNTAPFLEDISGSKHWDNMPDQELYCRKARFEELGYACKLALDFEVARGRYVSTDYR
jgi:twinkle protein